MEALRSFFSNKWVKFLIASTIWVLWFVVWTENPWMLFGLIVIYDIYISKFMYRLFWKKHKLRKANSVKYRKTMEWVEAIIFAVVVASVIKIYIFGMYVIPSGSMEKSLMIGDYLYVSKTAYGPVMPNTPVAFPFMHHTVPIINKKAFSESVQWPYHRLKGLGTVQRGDAVVFTFPAGDTVLLQDQASTYYDVLRRYEAELGPVQGREKLYKDYTVITRPVDKRENYIKRCVGIPGDSIRVVDSQLIVNGEPYPNPPGMQLVYYIYTNGTPISKNTLADMRISPSDMMFNQYEMVYAMPLTAENLERVKKMRNVVSVVPHMAEGPSPISIFPHDARYPWNEDNYGPLWVPQKGATVQLTPDNLPLYHRIIETYEGNKLEQADSLILINGEPALSYTFKMNYYFMMGDNRQNSADSRYWGFVPEDHVVGKASFVWLSLDKDRGWFKGKIRWSRMFRKVR